MRFFIIRLAPIKCLLIALIVVGLISVDYVLNSGRKLDSPTNSNYELLILIKSAPLHFNHRLTLRASLKQCAEALGAKNVKHKFAVGIPENEDNLTKALKHEVKLYKDILVCPFIDQYRANCYKTLHMIEYFAESDPKRRALFMDDDIYVNLSILINLALDEPAFYGNVMIGSRAIRNNRSKNYVSFQDFPEDRFPPYPSGGCYILSSIVAKKLHEARKSMSLPCVIDDAYLGMLAEQSNVSVLSHPKLKLGRIGKFGPMFNLLCSHAGSVPGRFVL